MVTSQAVRVNSAGMYGDTTGQLWWSRSRVRNAQPSSFLHTSEPKPLPAHYSRKHTNISEKQVTLQLVNASPSTPEISPTQPEMTANASRAPENASRLYKTLFSTATELIRCQDRDDSQPTRMNLDRVRAIRTSNCTHSFGHNHMVSTMRMPMLQGELGVDAYVAHLNKMVPQMDTWEACITDIVVDETRRMCIVRASYFMKPSGAEKPVENDLVWWLWMEEGGEKVEKALEFLDGAATGRIGELIMAASK
ncbi:hypothetical protein PMIN02_011855 [Paraphaeosphaeria minitans]